MENRKKDNGSNTETEKLNSNLKVLHLTQFGSLGHFVVKSK